MIEIRNDGPRLVFTNYWHTEHARRGLCYLSGNAGALRLLVPRAAADMLPEMRTGKSLLIEDSMSAPGAAYDLVFEDGSSSPFCLLLDRRQVDPPLSASTARPFVVITEDGPVLELTAKINL